MSSIANALPAAVLLLAAPAPAQTAAIAPTGYAAAQVQNVVSGPSYARLASLTLESPLVLDVTIRSTVRIRPAEAPDVAPGQARFYVTADVVGLIRGAEAVPSRVGYLLDVAPDASGRLPNLKRQRAVLFARPVAGRADQIQLVRTDAQFGWSPELDGRVRSVVRDVLDPSAAPAITGLGNAFHVPGSLPGEGETQIFLQTRRGDPVSLLVLRRPGEERRWAVALGDIIDEANGPPARDSFAWYRLACGLPPELPEASVAASDPSAAAIAREDYAFVRQALGACDDGRQ